MQQKKLQKEAKTQEKWNQNLQKKYEDIDNQATNIMLTAENKCSPTYLTIRAWSGKMRELGLQFRYWLTYYRHHSKKISNIELLKQSARNAQLQHEEISIEEIISQISTLRTKIRNMKKKTQRIETTDAPRISRRICN